MRTVIIILSALLVVAISVTGCKKEVPVDTEILTPYPPLTEQRAKLASKEWVTPTRIMDSAQIINDLEYI